MDFQYGGEMAFQKKDLCSGIGLSKLTKLHTYEEQLSNN